MGKVSGTDVVAVASSTFEEVVTVRDFMRDSVRPIIERFAGANNDDRTIYFLFLRALGWFGTLAELKHPQHFQAALAGTRTLLEIAVDLVLLHHDRQNLTPNMVLAWERSALLRAAERTERCFRGRQLPSEYAVRINFMNTEGPTIRQERATTWPKWKGKHPDRWTGRNLEADVLAADALGPYGFRDYYDGRFAELCWGAHGSGLAAIRFVDETLFPVHLARAFRESASLGVLVAKLSLQYFGKFDSIAEARFRKMERQKRAWSAAGFVASKAGAGPKPNGARLRK